MSKPKKILEVGVSAGGTSAIILRNTGPGQHLFAVDLADRYYRDPSKHVGWEVAVVCTQEEKSRYTLLSGKDIIDRLDEIGPEIDFCFLDSAHTLPGEFLQFLAIYPYLKEGAIVAFHDINANRPGPRGANPKVFHSQNATNLAFAAIGSRQKIIQADILPQIGALVVDNETRHTIPNCFMALGITWYYYPQDILSKYSKLFNKHYNKFCQNMFEHCVYNQRSMLSQRA